MKKISYKALLQHFSKRGHAYSWATSQDWGKWEDLEPSLQEPLRHNLTPPTPHAQDLELGTNGAVSSEHIVKMALVPDEQQRKLSIKCLHWGSVWKEGGSLLCSQPGVGVREPWCWGFLASRQQPQQKAARTESQGTALTKSVTQRPPPAQFPLLFCARSFDPHDMEVREQKMEETLSLKSWVTPGPQLVQEGVGIRRAATWTSGL